jgi:diaminopimelate epimerase
MVAAGNDFIVVDARAGNFKGRQPALSKAWCARRHGIGADGVLWLENSKRSDVRMRMFNPDGSEAEMCGNGVRCLAHFSVQKKIARPQLTVETLAGVIGVRVRGDLVKAKLPNPKGLKLRLSVAVNGSDRRLSFIDTGVPHAVVLVDALGRCDVEKLGRAIRNHRVFAPRGTNVDFLSIETDRSIHVRTYERGVEGETLSCGTGSTASALVAAALKDWKSPVSVHTAGGEVLKVYFTKTDGGFRDVCLEGIVCTSFEGRIIL